MCDPLTAASAALYAAGTVQKNRDQRALISAQNDANTAAAMASRQKYDEEARRQDQMRAQGQVQLDEATRRNTREAQDTALAKGEQDTTAGYEAAIPQLADPSRVQALVENSPTTNSVIEEDRRAQLAKALGNVRGEIAAKAKLDAFRGLGQTNAIARNRTDLDIGTLSGIRRGSLAVNQSERNVMPVQYTANPNSLADVMMGAGQLGVTAGAYNALKTPTRVPTPGGGGGAAMAL